MIQIIAAGENDYPAIQKIAHQTWPDTFKDILSENQLAYMLEKMYSEKSLDRQIREKRHCFLLAKEEEDCLGFISFETNFNGLPKTKIHKIYILPSAQGRGVGRSLISSAIDAAKQNNNPILSLNVNKYNLPAIRFYKKIGFYEARNEDIPIGNGYWMEDVVMEMKLTGSAI